MKLPRWRLFPKYATLIIAVVAGVLVVSGAINLVFSWRETQAHLVALQIEKAQGAAWRIERYILDIEHELGWTAFPLLDTTSDPLEQRRIEYLKLLKQVDSITELVWIGPDGRERLRESRLAMSTMGTGTDLSKEPYFIAARAGKETWFGPVQFRKGTEPYMSIARPAGGDGGVTVADVNLKFVWDVVSRIKIGQNGLAYAVDATGTLIAHPDISLVLKKTDLKVLPQVAALERGDSGQPVVARDLAGQEVFTAHARIPTLNWTVFVESPRAEALAPLRESIVRLVLLLVGGLLLAAAESFVLARALVRPIRALQEGAARVGAGELDQRIQIKTGDELEGLAEQFNQMGAALQASYAGLERKVEERTHELSEALERQTATAEILKVISGSPTDVQPVFDAIVASCQHLCGGKSVDLLLAVDELIERVAVASEGDVTGGASVKCWPLDRSSVSGDCILRAEVVSVPDRDTVFEIYPRTRELATAIGWRSGIFVPLLREGKAIGCIAILRAVPGHFDAKEVSLAQVFADQAVIAIENVRLFNETKEALEHQTATAEVLQVISSSVSNATPVFEKILDSCQRLFGANDLGVFLAGDDGLLRPGAFRGILMDTTAHTYPRPLAGTVSGMAIDKGSVLHVPDMLNARAMPQYIRDFAGKAGNFSVALAPMMWEGRGIGTIDIIRTPPRPYSDTELALLKTFADQAVIAIQNSRLFNETKEALERQTATSEVLRVISESPADAQPALDAVAERARLLCKAQGSRVWLPDGDRLRSATGYKLDDGSDGGRGEVLPMKSTSVMGRAFVERRIVQVDDIEGLLDSTYPDAREVQQRHRFRSILAVPLLREGIALGVIGLTRKDVKPFGDSEIELVQTFADQAVIAIENVRLFNETRESLERQTATAEILKVIASSPTDVQPVFAVIVESAVRLCGARFGRVYRYDGSLIEMVASHGLSTHGLGLVQRVFPRPAAADTIVGRVVLAGQPYFVNDVEQDASVPALSRQMIEALGTRSQLTIPILRAGDSIGAITMGWAEPAGFDDQRVALLQTFADQAVIAIENVRLFNETKEALEQQTATAEVLRVISGSVSDTAPVFEKILHSCSHLFESSEQGIVLLGDDGRLRLGAHRGTAREKLAAMFPIEAGDEPVARAMAEQRVLHYPDVLRDAEPGSLSRVVAERLGVGSYTQVFAPMRWEGRGVGYLYVIRSPVSSFSDKEIGLLKTFGDQAAIAIQNARLFNEIQSKSRQLEAANRHKSEFLANMSHELRTPLNAIIGFSEVLVEKMFGDVNDKQMEYLKDIHSSGQHLLALINDVLDLSKIEAGKMELDLSCFDLGLLLEHSATLVRERAQRHGLALELEVDDGLAEWVADARKVKQVVVNLLSNAVKFTPNGGRVSVRARHLNGVDGRAGEWAEVSVSDTGVGIAPADQALVFEEFRQASGDVLRKAEGTGLGLALVKRFVELHGGEVTLDSEPGRGSTFRFTLPQHEVKVLQ